MPKLMEKSDWIQTVMNVSTAKGVWSETVVSSAGTIPLPIPEEGNYQVILVKIDAQPTTKPKHRSACDMIGYGEKFHKLRTTDEWMRELREGEES